MSKNKIQPNRVSIIIPAKDEEHNLRELLPRLKTVIQNIKKGTSMNFEIIVVCDNCSDGTEKVARSHKVKIISRKGNPGKSKALVEGFKKAKGEILVMMDADLSHLPEELPRMLKKLHSKEDIGLVIASRKLGASDDVTIIRDIGGILMNMATNLLFGTKLTDTINGYKIFKRAVFDDYVYEADGYAIEIELVANALRGKMKVHEVPSYEAPRKSGKAKSKVIKDGWLFFREIFSEGISYNLEKVGISKAKHFKK